MNQIIEIRITAEIPEDKSSLGHKAIVASEDAALGIVTQLEQLGLTNVKEDRRLVKRKAVKVDAAPPVAAPPVAPAQAAAEAQV